MKKLLIILALTLFSGAIWAQTITKSFPISSFVGIDAGGVFDIEITKSDKESVSVETTAELMKFVKVNTNSGMLYLELDSYNMPRRLTKTMTEIKVKISMKNLEKLSLSGASKLFSNSSFDVKNFNARISGAAYISQLQINSLNSTISLSGASKIKMKQKCQYIQIDLSGASMGIIQGECQKMEAEISGAAKLDAYNLSASEVSIETSGASLASLFAQKVLSIDASGASSVKYKGDASIKSKTVSGAANVKRVN